MITIITATFNAERDLPQLILSLRSQTSSQFQWIVADGGSVDNTLQIIKHNQDLITTFIPGPDFGIYDAINKAIKNVNTKYYLTLGADDSLNPKAVEQFNNATENSNADFISAVVRTTQGTRLTPKRGCKFRYGHLAYISQHAVGTLIKKELHTTVGAYSQRYPIAADRYFVLKAIEQHGCKVQAEQFEAGTYSCEGTSSTQLYDTLLDIFKVDYALSKNPSLTSILSLFRYIANILKM